jgi:hypothetical protein
MLRKCVAAVGVLVVCLGVAVADEFMAVITKVQDGKVTFSKFKKGEGKKGEKGPEMTLPAAADVKVVTSKFNKDTGKAEAGEALSGGLKNERFSNLGEKGAFAQIVTDADNKKITEIRVFGGKGKGKKKKDAE